MLRVFSHGGGHLLNRPGLASVLSAKNLCAAAMRRTSSSSLRLQGFMGLVAYGKPPSSVIRHLAEGSEAGRFGRD